MRAVLLTCTVASGLALSGTAFAGGSGSLTLPASASVGTKLHVDATGLKPGVYAVTLAAPTAPSRNDYCLSVLASSHRRVTRVAFTVRIPARIECHSGFPAASAGTEPTTPGRYTLTVAVLQGFSPTSGYSVLSRKLAVR